MENYGQSMQFSVILPTRKDDLPRLVTRDLMRGCLSRGAAHSSEVTVSSAESAAVRLGRLS